MKSMIRRVRTYLRVGCLSLCLPVVAVGIGGCAVEAEWPQWGGPHRDFTADAEGLAESWPDDGPDKLWYRELGDGYSTITVDHGVLYTTYRTDHDEFTVALDAKTGKTIWEHKNPSPFTDQMTQFGPGPHSTPLIVGSRLYTVGTNAMMHCFNKKTGKVLWKHDLVEEFGAPIHGYGYGCSPIAYQGTIILAVGREREEHPEGSEEEPETETEKTEVADGQSLVAFDQATGDVVWKNQDYPVNYSSPILINFDGEEQLVLLMSKDIIGVKPDNGELLWHHEITPTGSNIATPVWNAEDLLFMSSAYASGSRAIKLTKEEGKTVADQLWYTRKMRIHHANAIRIGDYVYGSSGDFGPAFFAALNIKTGKVAWRERGFAKATCVLADGKLVILDENGQLALATATPEGLTVHAKCKITELYSWAAPTLVGKTLYVRDRKHIMALDLG